MAERGCNLLTTQLFWLRRSLPYLDGWFVEQERHRTKQLLATQEILFPGLYHSLLTAMKPLMARDRVGLESSKMKEGNYEEFLWRAERGLVSSQTSKCGIVFVVALNRIINRFRRTISTWKTIKKMSPTLIVCEIEMTLAIARGKWNICWSRAEWCLSEWQYGKQGDLYNTEHCYFYFRLRPVPPSLMDRLARSEKHARIKTWPRRRKAENVRAKMARFLLLVRAARDSRATMFYLRAFLASPSTNHEE